MKTMLVGVALLGISLYADTLVLRTGSHIQGQLVSAQPGTIVFREGGARQARRYNSNDVARIEFNTGNDAGDRVNSDYYGGDQHNRYDQYRGSDYRENQPQGGAIAAKYQDMVRAGLGLGQPLTAEQTSSDGEGHFRSYQNSTIYWSPRTGAHEVHGAVREQYLRLGAEVGRLGYPTSDELAAPDGIGRINNFEHGSIYWSARTGVRVDYGR